MFDNEEDLINLCKTIAIGEQDSLIENNYHPKFVWIDEENGPRLFMFPEIPGTADTRNEDMAKIGWALHVLSSVQRAKYLTFAVDSYQAKSATKHDGTEWGVGEMGYAFNNKTVDADLVFESFTITITDRDGWHAMVAVPYYRDGAGGILFEWDEVTAFVESADAGESSAGGMFPELMGSAMTQPNILDAHEALQKFADHLGFSEDKRDMHMLCAAVKQVMKETGFPCAIPAWNVEEKETMTTSFSGEDEIHAEPVEFE